MIPVAVVTDPSCRLHEPGPAHADAPGRLPALEEAVRSDAALASLVEERRARPVREEDLLRVHSVEHLGQVRAASRRAREDGRLAWLDDDTPVSAGSWEAAQAAAACAVSAAEAVVDGEAGAAFALCRPPGHHATRDRAMGFCLLNNVAIAVRWAQARRGVARALVLDWDAHHGNGTQDVFYEDGSVYVASLHLSPAYPGSGDAAERGAGAGVGTTLNVPLPVATEPAEYRRRHLQALDAVFSGFQPDLVFVSAGLDCLAGDPEGGLLLRPRDLHRITLDLLERMPRTAQRRVVGVLEGGYAPERIGAGLVDVLRALAGLPPAEVAPSAVLP